MTIESQFDRFKPDKGQYFDFDMLPDERSETVAALLRAVEEIHGPLGDAIGRILLAVSRSYEIGLTDPRHEMSRDERDSRDQWTRGVIAGLARANDYLTNPRYGAELLKFINPEYKEPETDVAR